ncbi:MAG: CvpA family protein [Verrucomicrobiota bacterium]
MIIWLSALVLLGLLALIGFYQGAIRVAISLIGLFVAALLAMPLSPMLKPILPLVKLKHPIWELFLPPLAIFILVMIIFKIVALFVHRKVDVFYKYKRDDKTRFKWERMNQRVGMCLGLVNGTVYFVLLLIPFYVAGYLTTQLATGEEDPDGMKFINRARREIHESKMDKVVAAYDPAPTNYYVAADIVGLVKNNPLLNSRLSHYPVFLSLAERKEFQDIATDVQINEMIQTQAKIGDIINHPKVQAVITNSQITTEISTLLGSDLHDLYQYLLSGKSEKYDDEKILGLWTLNLDATVAQEKVSKPKITPFELKRLKQTKYAPLYGITFIGTTDNKAILKHPASAAGAPPEIVAQGTWKESGSNYEVTLGSASAKVTFENDKLFLPKDGMTLVFEKEL